MAEVDGGIAPGQALGDGKAEHHADVLPQPLGHVERAARLRDPQRRQDLRRLDLVDPALAERREDVALEP